MIWRESFIRLKLWARYRLFCVKERCGKKVILLHARSGLWFNYRASSRFFGLKHQDRDSAG